MQPLALVIGEKEQLVLLYRPADSTRRTSLLLKGRLHSIEVPSGIEILVTQELERRPMNTVGARSGITLITAPPVANPASVLATCYFEFTDALQIRKDLDRADHLVAVVEAVDGEQIEGASCAGGGDLGAVSLGFVAALGLANAAHGPGVVPGTNSASCEKLRPFKGS